MTINQAIDSGIPAVRKPFWADPQAKLELPPRIQGGYGFWCKLHDGGATIPITIFDADDREDDWEPVLTP